MVKIDGYAAGGQKQIIEPVGPAPKTLNIHKLPPCPLCNGPMKIGTAMSGPKIYCMEYQTCGGIIHNLNVVPKKTKVSDNEDGPSPGSANYMRMQGR